MSHSSISLSPIAFIESPYREKFAIPRQPGLVPSAKGKVILQAPFNQSDMVKGLEQFSHIWLIFNFHATQAQGWKPLVRPPRLGGNKKIGVLATRSTFRPNPIGMSVVKLEGITCNKQEVSLTISALDLLHGTPILDIKPYIPYSDAITQVNGSYADNAPEIVMSVEFSQQAKQDLTAFNHEYPELEALITEVLAQDPRPAYKKQTLDEKIYGMQLYDINIQWQLCDLSHIQVLSLKPKMK